MQFSTILAILFTTALAAPTAQPQRQAGPYDAGGAFNDLVSEGAHQAGHLTGDLGMSILHPIFFPWK